MAGEKSDGEPVTEEDAIVQTPNGERYESLEIDRTGRTSEK